MNNTDTKPTISQLNTIPNGYKKTVIGIIPENWEVNDLGSLGDFKSGNGFPINEQGGVNGIPFYKVSDMNLPENEVFMTISNNYISEEQVINLKMKPIKDEAIIFAKVGAAIFLERKRFAQNFLIDNNMMAFVPKTPSIYLKYYLDYIRLSKYAQTGALPAYNASDLKTIQLPIPPLPEQKKIAEILTTWDEAIVNCKSTINSLKDRNKGLAQQLNTGKKRLRGFDDKWKIKKIKDFSLEISMKNKNDDDLVVLSCTKHNGLVPSLEYFGRKIYSDNLKTYKIVEKNVFAYATNHIEEGSIGYQSKYEKALISPMYTVFKTDDDINDEFLFRVLKSNTYIQEYQKRMEGSIDRRGGLRWQEFSKIKVSVPPYEEQTAIALALETADQELKSYETKLEALQLQKKGLMQQLLTGKIRVNVK